MKKICLALIFVFIIAILAIRVSEADQIRTTETFVGNSESQISSQVNKAFSIYIGDNISGVTNPVKSVYFTVSGVYTGGGTLQLMIDSDTDTSKTFTLPTVSGPTPFEVLYKDNSNKINPTSSGNYSYTLNVIPSGVTISGLGIKVTTTYRYKPSGTGGGGQPSGELISAVFDTTGSSDGPAYNSILWKGTPGTGKVRFKLATSDSPTGPWEYRGPEPSCSTVETGDSNWYVADSDSSSEIGCVSYHNNKRYFKYKIQLCSASDCTSFGATSPEVQDVVIDWSP